MGIIIDTNVFIGIEHTRKKWTNISERFAEHGDAFISSVTASELLVGVERLKGKESIRCGSFVEKILENIPVIGFSLHEARIYTRLWMVFLSRKSKGPGTHDLQIAATAIANGMPLLTSNIKDFKKIPGLELLQV